MLFQCTKHSTTTAYRWSESGKNERFKKTLIAGLRDCKAWYQTDWDIYRQQLKYAYDAIVPDRRIYHNSTLFWPFTLQLTTFDNPTVFPAGRKVTACPRAFEQNCYKELRQCKYRCCVDMRTITVEPFALHYRCLQPGNMSTSTAHPWKFQLQSNWQLSCAISCCQSGRVQESQFKCRQRRLR